MAAALRYAGELPGGRPRQWFAPEAARAKILAGQAPLIDRLLERLDPCCIRSLSAETDLYSRGDGGLDSARGSD